MKNFTKLFVVVIALFTTSTLSAQILSPSVDLDLSDNNAEINLVVDAGSTISTPVIIQDALGLVLGLVSNINVTVEGSPNFQITDVKRDLLGLNLGSFKLNFTANGAPGTEETAKVTVSIITPLRSTTQVSAVMKAQIR